MRSWKQVNRAFIGHEEAGEFNSPRLHCDCGLFALLRCGCLVQRRLEQRLEIAKEQDQLPPGEQDGHAKEERRVILYLFLYLCYNTSRKKGGEIEQIRATYAEQECSREACQA